MWTIIILFVSLINKKLPKMGQTATALLEGYKKEEEERREEDLPRSHSSHQCGIWSERGLDEPGIWSEQCPDFDDPQNQEQEQISSKFWSDNIDDYCAYEDDVEQEIPLDIDDDLDGFVEYRGSDLIIEEEPEPLPVKKSVKFGTVSVSSFDVNSSNQFQMPDNNETYETTINPKRSASFTLIKSNTAVDINGNAGVEGEKLGDEISLKGDLGDFRRIDKPKPLKQGTTMIHGYFHSTEAAEDTVYISYNSSYTAESFMTSQPLENLLGKLDCPDVDFGDQEQEEESLTPEDVQIRQKYLFFSNLKHFLNHAYGALEWNGAIVVGFEKPKNRIEVMEVVSYDLEGPKLFLDIENPSKLEISRNGNKLEFRLPSETDEGIIMKTFCVTGPSVNFVSFDDPDVGVLKLNFPWLDDRQNLVL